MIPISYESIKNELKNLNKVNTLTHVDVAYFISNDVIFSVEKNIILNIYYKNVEGMYNETQDFISNAFSQWDIVEVVFDSVQRKIIDGLVKKLPIQTIDIRDKSLVLICNTRKTYQKNSLTKKEVNLMVASSMKMAKEMRTHYFQISKPLSQTRTEPIFGRKINGMPTSSLGPFPEFVISTFPCEKTMHGFCVPCFFSKVEMPDATRQDIYGSFAKQIKFIVDNFDQYVLDYQSRTGYAKELIKDVTFCLACNGSIFSNAECLKHDRIHAFKILLEEVKRRKLGVKVYLESCVSDYLTLIKSEDCDETIECLQALHATILFGFESVEEFTREKIYIKGLTIKDFEEAYFFNERNKIGTGAFLYTGYHSMVENEIIIDFVKTLCYVTDKNILPVLMISNVQKYTIPYLLYKDNKYSIMDPLTAWTLFKLLVWFTQDKNNDLTDKWLMGDVFGGPPIPEINVFSNSKKSSCEHCSNSIRLALQNIRRSLKYTDIQKVDSSLKQCASGCWEKHIEQLRLRDNLRLQKSLDIRVSENIRHAEHILSRYLFEEDIGLLKKLLLCHGVRIDEQTYKELKDYNYIFGEEKNIHIAQIQLPDGKFVNANSQEKYNKTSPYSLRRINNVWYIYKQNNKICEVQIQKIPEWALRCLADGTHVLDVIVPHGNNVLALSRHRPCCFKLAKEGCKFCSSVPYSKTLSEHDRLSQLREALILAKESGIEYSFALSGGTSETADRGIYEFIKEIRIIKEIMPNTKISIEVAPPESNNYLDLLINEEIDSITMNLEFYDDQIRRKICPGKSKISIERYFEALKYCVERLGCGNVSSVLIAGIEDSAMTCTGARKLIDIGVLPTIIPFRPYDQCEMSNYPTTDVECLLDIERDLEQYALKKNFRYCKGAGCVGCNACIGINIYGDIQ